MKMKRCISLLLTFVLVFAFAVTAQAAANISAIPSKSQTKPTPWGTMTGSIYYATSDEWSANPERQIVAVTEIDSSRTMAEIKAEVECQNNATGETDPRWQNTSIERNSNRTSTRVFMNPPKASTMIAYTNHEVTYSSSVNLYMSYLMGPVQE